MNYNVAAVIIIAMQAVIVALLLYYVRTFGAYTEALERTHKSNTILYLQAVKVIEYAETIMNKEKIA